MSAQPRSPVDVTDESLARRARAGDMAALDSLARRWQVPLVRFLERRIGSHADAEDLFQEAFIRVHQHLQDYDDRRSFKTWIFTIAWRLAANHLRDRRKSMDPEVMEGMAGDEQSPQEPAEQKDLHQNLWAIAKRELSDDHYTVLWMFYVEQLSPREIASVTGKSWVAIKTSLHRARRALEPHVRTIERMA